MQAKRSAKAREKALCIISEFEIQRATGSRSTSPCMETIAQRADKAAKIDEDSMKGDADKRTRPLPEKRKEPKEEAAADALLM